MFDDHNALVITIRDFHHGLLAGFFEYFLGCNLEKRGSPKAGAHFEYAFGCLRPYATDMAHTVRCILGLKMNWFRLLKDCGPASPFFPAKLFNCFS
jgi:hypothetical protein